MREVDIADNLYLQAPVEPPLDESNAVGRFVLVNRNEFPHVGTLETGGWVGKIISVHKGTKLTTVQMSDTRKHWLLSYIQESFKPLS